MPRHVYVGNLSAETSPDALRAAFEQNGRKVVEVALVKSPKTGKPRGFAFVEMESDEQAEAVIRELDGTEIDGKAMKVGEGKQRPEFRLRTVVEPTRRGARGGRR